MKVTMEWLRDWVDPGDDAGALADSLTLAGLEVDSVDAAAADLDGIRIALVREVRAHPNADRLSLCTVFDGSDEYEIVCGAPNVAPGIKVPLAVVGTTLPGGLKIKAAKIRGQASNGMLCSAAELMLSDESAGLLILDQDAEVGQALAAHLRLPDHVIDIDLTPNRGDCFSIVGVAREIAARRGVGLAGPRLDTIAASMATAHPPRTEAPAECPRFATRCIAGLDNGARTPDWMRERLRRVGLRPISPVVDVTNYVMWELGQPLHAYSAGKLSGQLHARLARGGEQLELLDGSEIELAADVLVIADDSGAVGLAGIMGGASTAIDTDTTDIVLESAFFSPGAIAGRARRYGLHTDASVRFERGVDPGAQERALERATELLQAIAGGTPGPVAVAESADHLPRRATVRLRKARLAAVLGVLPSSSDVVTWLTALAMHVRDTDNGWDIVPPAHRFDIEIEEDLIEEIGRMLGYDRIEPVPGTAEVHLGPATEAAVGVDEIADIAVARGYDEIISFSFVDPASVAAVTPAAAPPVLANPISQDLSVMRSSLWPGLLKAAQANLSRQRGRCRLFETGTVFIDETTERSAIAGVVVGSLHPEHWDDPARAADYFDVKADVVALLEATGRASEMEWSSLDHPALSPATATALSIGDQCAGHLGTLHPALAKTFDLPQGTVLFDLYLDVAFKGRVAAYKPVSKFPHVRRDLALVVTESVRAGDLTKSVADELGESLARCIVFDEYRGKALESGTKSIGLGLILQDASRTLTDADADDMLATAARRLEHELGARIRT